jgi:hypothetical protein
MGFSLIDRQIIASAWERVKKIPESRNIQLTSEFFIIDTELREAHTFGRSPAYFTGNKLEALYLCPICLRTG